VELAGGVHPGGGAAGEFVAPRRAGTEKEGRGASPGFCGGEGARLGAYDTGGNGDTDTGGGGAFECCEDKAWTTLAIDGGGA
jgi:hypothetical protein